MFRIGRFDKLDCDKLADLSDSVKLADLTNWTKLVRFERFGTNWPILPNSPI